MAVLTPAQEVEVYAHFCEFGQRATAKRFGLRDQLVADIAARKPDAAALVSVSKPTGAEWTHRWFLRSILPQYHGMVCKIVSCVGKRPAGWCGLLKVEFPDGKTTLASVTALRRVRRAG